MGNPNSAENIREVDSEVLKMKIVSRRGRKEPVAKEPKRNRKGSWPFPVQPPSPDTENEEVIRKTTQDVDIDISKPDEQTATCRFNRDLRFISKLKST